MAPEHKAQPGAFYDHESDEPTRHRRPAADWGVGEDIFDRMPSRRFKRSDHRAEEHEIVIRRADPGEYAEATWVDEAPAHGEWDDAEGPVEPRQVVAVWEDDAPATRRVD